MIETIVFVVVVSWLFGVMAVLTYFVVHEAIRALSGCMIGHRKCGGCKRFGHKEDMVYQRDSFGHSWYHPECRPRLQGEKKS